MRDGGAVGADEVVSAVVRGAEDEVGGGKGVKGPAEVGGGEPRAIGADEDGLVGALAQALLEGVEHTVSEVVVALGAELVGVVAEPVGHPVPGVGGAEEDIGRGAPRGAAHAAQGVPNQGAIDLDGHRVAGGCGEPGLHLAGGRVFAEHDNRAMGAAIAPGKAFRGHSEAVEPVRGPVQPGLPEAAVLFPASGGGDGGGGDHDQPAPAAEATDKVNVFHQGEVGIAAAGSEARRRGEQGLVAVGQPEESAAPAHAPLDEAVGPIRVIELEPECPDSETGPGGGIGDLVGPVGGKGGIRVEEDQDRAGGVGGAGIHLAGASGGGIDPDDAGKAGGDLPGAVRAAAVGHEDLGVRGLAAQGLEPGADGLLLVQGGEDDRGGRDQASLNSETRAWTVALASPKSMRVLAEEQRVVDAGEAGLEAALEHDAGPGLVDVDDGHAVDRAASRRRGRRG